MSCCKFFFLFGADDSYFSFAEDFVNNTISLRDLNLAMQLGTLGEQVVLLSKRSFKQIEFVEYEIADYREYIKVHDILVGIAIILYGASPFLCKLDVFCAIKALSVVVVFLAYTKFRRPSKEKSR